MKKYKPIFIGAAILFVLCWIILILHPDYRIALGSDEQQNPNILCEIAIVIIAIILTLTILSAAVYFIWEFIKNLLPKSSILEEDSSKMYHLDFPANKILTGPLTKDVRKEMGHSTEKKNDT